MTQEQIARFAEKLCALAQECDGEEYVGYAQMVSTDIIEEVAAACRQLGHAVEIRGNGVLEKSLTVRVRTTQE